MKKKPVLYTEWCYIFGLLLLAFGTALTERGGFGISVVVAPAYILHLKLSDILPWFSFGVAEYVLQAFVLLLLMLTMQKVKLSYFLAFATALIYGVVLDGSMVITGMLTGVPAIVLYMVGVVICSAGVAFLVQTYLPPEVYELFVKELSRKLGIEFSKFKVFYDCGSCLLAVLMSLVLFGGIRGLGVGSIVCAFLNGVLIGWFTKLYGKIWTFEDRFAKRQFFEGRTDEI